MQNETYKKIEVVGTSSTSLSEAIQSGIERAARTVKHTSWFEVSELRGSIQDGKVAEYQVAMKIGFRLE